jgi:hypothetical protein
MPNLETIKTPLPGTSDVLTVTRSHLGVAVYKSTADGYEHCVGLFNSLAAAEQHLKALGATVPAKVKP